MGQVHHKNGRRFSDLTLSEKARVVESVHYLIDKGLPIRKISQMLPISRGSIQNIKNGKRAINDGLKDDMKDKRDGVFRGVARVYCICSRCKRPLPCVACARELRQQRKGVLRENILSEEIDEVLSFSKEIQEATKEIREGRWKVGRKAWDEEEYHQRAGIMIEPPLMTSPKIDFHVGEQIY